MSVSCELSQKEFFPQVTNPVPWAVFHLLGWISATLLLWISWEVALSDAVSAAAAEHWRRSELRVVLVLTGMEAAVLGLTVWVSAIAVARIVRGKAFFHHPGHWLLAVIGVGAVAHVFSGAAQYYLGDLLVRSVRGTNPAFAVTAALLLLKPIVYWLAVRIGVGGFRWRMVFVALAIWTLCNALTFLVTTQTPIWRFHRWTTLLSSALTQVSSEPTVVLIPFLVVAVPTAAVLDYRSVTRDWFHWIGVGAATWILTWSLVALWMAH